MFSLMKKDPPPSETALCPRCSRHLAGENINFCPSCGTKVSPRQLTESTPFPLSPNQGGSPPDTQPASAGFWVRLGAFWLDAISILSIAMLIGSLTYSTAIGKALFPNRDKVGLFFALLFIIYHALFLGRFRTTPGKRFFGLGISPVNPSGRFGYSDAFLRTLGYFVSAVCLGIGFLFIVLDPRNQGWHDKIAGTLVIKKHRVPLFHRVITLLAVTLLVATMIALQFNLTLVYRSVFDHAQRSWRERGKEIVTVLVTHKEIREETIKEIMTRAGPYTIRVPHSARDGQIFRVNRIEEEGGEFYIRIIIVERI